MKNHFKTLLILAVLVSTIACNNSSKETQDASNHVNVQVDLDGEKRWIANPETTDGVDNMIQLMDSFQGAEDVASYKTLTENLELEFQMIFKKCTMSGAAHDQLHSYLFPMKEKFKKLSSSDLNDCKSAFADLKAHLSVYDQYFE